MLARRRAAIFLLSLLVPLVASAAPFGGRVGTSIYCANGVILAQVGGPVGGLFLWAPSTKTYAFGPPAAGKWVLGLSGAPYYCLVSILPLITSPGILMTMVGSSQ